MNVHELNRQKVVLEAFGLNRMHRSEKKTQDLNGV
jgi:hypothetical protein